MNCKTLLLPILLLVLVFTTTNHTIYAPNYKIVRRIPLAGDGSWDHPAVDEVGRRLFITHGTQVQVIDLGTGKQVGAIPDLKGVHGVALYPELRKGFISCGQDTSVIIFNQETLVVLDKVKVTGSDPDAIVYDPFSRQVFVFNHNSANATVIDASTNKIVATIALGGAPEFAVTDKKGMIYVNIGNKNLVAVIDATTLKVVHNWPVAPGEKPMGLAIDRQRNRLFAVCGNQKMAVMDAQNGKIIQSLPIGASAHGVVYDPGPNRVFSSNGTGNLTVVAAESPEKYKVMETMATRQGARTIGLDLRTHHLYLPVAEYEKVPGESRPQVKAGTFTVLEVAE